tara:strand:+ start:90 stop:488 length:399 start_codon:yes stop_codon:yes gene_type:complete
MKLIKAIKSNTTAFITAVSIIMFVQVPHLMIVFAGLSELPELYAYIHGGLYAVSVDLGVLFFAVRGKTLQTIIFMFVSALITVEYYYLEVVNRIGEQNYLGALIIILVAITPSILIYFISEEMKIKTRKRRK